MAKTGKLPVVNFAAGGIATPADAALMMQLGMDGVFVGSGILNLKPGSPGRAIVKQLPTIMIRSFGQGIKGLGKQ